MSKDLAGQVKHHELPEETGIVPLNHIRMPHLGFTCHSHLSSTAWPVRRAGGLAPECAVLLVDGRRRSWTPTRAKRHPVSQTPACHVSRSRVQAFLVQAVARMFASVLVVHQSTR